MIPMWLKIIWSCLGLGIFIYSIFPISGSIVKAFTELSGDKLHKDTEKELKEAWNLLIVLVLIWIAMFVGIMLFYKIPFNQWVG